MSRNLALLLFAVGWLSAVSARPYGFKQDADKQSIAYLPYYPSQQDQNTNEQGIRFTYPQTRSTTAEKEGSVSFDWAKQQYMPQAEEEGIRYNFQYPFKNQATAKQQIVGYGRTRLPYAWKSGFSIRLPQQQAFGNYQGLRLTLPQKQENSEEQSYSFQWPQQQSITIPFSQETAKKEGFTYPYPQVQESDAEKQRIGVSIGWLQGQEQSQTGEEQRIGFSYHWPRSKQENAKEEGITFTYPQKQTSTAEKEGIIISLPQKERNTAETQHAGITINWPQQLQEVTKEDLSEIIEKLLAEQE